LGEEGKKNGRGVDTAIILESLIAHYCNAVIPTTDLESSIETWQQNAMLVLSQVINVCSNGVPPIVHFLRVCNDLAKFVLIPLEPKGSSDEWLTRLGAFKKDLAASFVSREMFNLIVTQFSKSQVPGSNIFFTKFLAHFLDARESMDDEDFLFCPRFVPREEPADGVGVDEEFDSCSICFEEYEDTEQKRPVSLSCGHSFCEGCLNKCPDENGLECPVCREKTEVPRANDGSCRWCKNFSLLQMIEKGRAQKARELKLRQARQEAERTEHEEKKDPLQSLLEIVFSL
jgi:hypothetical protein